MAVGLYDWAVLVDHRAGRRFWAGGGIVANSRADTEYQECLDKAATLLNLMQRHRLG